MLYMREAGLKEQLVTVTGPIDVAWAGVTDAHNHVWISPVPASDPNGPVLDNQDLIAEELRDYRKTGGGTQIDCQPGGCGRNGRKLRELAEYSGVHIVACTGFHLRKYYQDDYWLFAASTEAAYRHFVAELTTGLDETLSLPEPARAGFIKIACQDSLEKSPKPLIEAAVAASLETGRAVVVHTEKGADVERIVQFLLDSGLRAERLVLCHMDKQVDLELHRHLAQAGIMLEYDTFYRQKYNPEENVWPLLEHMVAGGYASQIAIGTDMAGTQMWSRLGGKPGLTGLILEITPRLESIGFDKGTIKKLTGDNIASRLACPVYQPVGEIGSEHA